MVTLVPAVPLGGEKLVMPGAAGAWPSTLLRKTQAAKTPTFVSDLLLHFYDDKVRDDEAAELFIQGVLALERLSQAGPVIISASPGTERTQLYAMLHRNAGRVTRLSEGLNHGS